MPVPPFLQTDVARCGVTLDPRDWSELEKRVFEVRVPRGGRIQSQARIADVWLLLQEGVAASEQTWSDGTSTIARFFEPGHVCANLTSAWTRDFASDDLVALTDVAGVAIPDDVFRREYLQGDGFGTYLRLKMMEAHLFAKELICAKTSAQTEARYRFLIDHHDIVVGAVRKQDIARFLGITPQGLSRFLRRREAGQA